jgi:hypothetical protein
MKGKNKDKVIGVRVTPEQQASLKEYSQTTQVSQSTLIRIAIRRLLSELDKTKNPDKVFFEL